jgi:hypothetical protein
VPFVCCPSPNTSAQVKVSRHAPVDAVSCHLYRGRCSALCGPWSLRQDHIDELQQSRVERVVEPMLLAAEPKSHEVLDVRLQPIPSTRTLCSSRRT